MELKDELEEYAVNLIARRLDRLKRRKFVLFPWLRIKWLMRKYSKIGKFLG